MYTLYGNIFRPKIGWDAKEFIEKVFSKLYRIIFLYNEIKRGDIEFWAMCKTLTVELSKSPFYGQIVSVHDSEKLWCFNGSRRVYSVYINFRNTPTFCIYYVNIYNNLVFY